MRLFLDGSRSSGGGVHDVEPAAAGMSAAGAADRRGDEGLDMGDEVGMC